MNPPNSLIEPIVAGVVAAVAWIVAWAILVPETAPYLAWSGYDSPTMVTLLFLVGYFARLWLTLRSGG